MNSLIIADGHVMEHSGKGEAGVPHASTPRFIAKTKMMEDGRWIVAQRVPPKNIGHAVVSAKIQVLLCEAGDDPDGNTLRDPLVIHEVIGDGDILVERVEKTVMLLSRYNPLKEESADAHRLATTIRKKIVAHDQKKARTAKAEAAHEAHIATLEGLIARLKEYGYDGTASCRGVILDQNTFENILADLTLLMEARGMLEGIQRHVHGRHHAKVQETSFGALERDTPIATCDQHPCPAVRTFLKNFEK